MICVWVVELGGGSMGGGEGCIYILAGPKCTNKNSRFYLKETLNVSIWLLRLRFQLHLGVGIT